jgi:alanine-synthesizing transaminase
VFASRTNWNLSTNRFSSTLEKLRNSGREILDLTVSNPTDCGLTYPPDLLDLLRDPAALNYEPTPKGLLLAREAVCHYYAELPQPVEIHPHDVFLTTSTSEAYSFVMRLLCDPHDEIMVPHPGYPLFEFLAGVNDVCLRPYQLLYDHGWHLDLHAIRQNVTPHTKAIALVHPNNPTGSFVKREEARELSAFAAAMDRALVVDEVFLDYAFETGESWSFAGNEQALTFTLSGLSKVSGLPQIKLAWCVVSGPEKQKMDAISRLEIIADTYLSLNAPVQRATPRLLEFRKDFQSQLKARLDANLRELDRQLAEQQNVSRLRCEGGWYVVLRVPITRTDEELALELMERQSVLVHPGHFFDFPHDGYLIVSLMTQEVTFQQGIAGIIALLAD